jgi:hypothetical protein
MAEPARHDADDSEGLQTDLVPDLTDTDTKLNLFDFCTSVLLIEIWEW